MHKWYEDNKSNEIISSRIRLARNIKKYPFSSKINNGQSEKMIHEVKTSIINDRNPLAASIQYIPLNELSLFEKHSLMEKHIISPVLLGKKEPCACMVKDDETISIMLNEEDHIRLQTIFPGSKINGAWDLADKIDNLIEETLEYAFDKDFGYLTSCPTNVGTGIRASYMAHLPILTMTGQLKNVITAIAKFGITVRGTYGEGSESFGSIYQISNQVTIGLSEEEIITNLTNLTKQVIEKERYFRDKIITENKDALEDKVYRAYGVLKYAKKLTSKEAIELLSDIKLGYTSGLLKEPPLRQSIYQIIINTQPGCLQKSFHVENNADKRDMLRAQYIREQM